MEKTLKFIDWLKQIQMRTASGQEAFTNLICVYSGHIDPPFRLIDPFAGGIIPEGQPKNGLQ